jgi:hypothetical protein
VQQQLNNVAHRPVEPTSRYMMHPVSLTCFAFAFFFLPAYTILDRFPKPGLLGPADRLFDAKTDSTVGAQFDIHDAPVTSLSCPCLGCGIVCASEKNKLARMG